VRWQRERAMQLWQMDILTGPMIVDPATGELRESRIVTGVDDHSRYCVIARIVGRATGRAVCLAFAEALKRHGGPDEVLTDNGKQFTARFGLGVGEVLFDRICRRNGIAHRLTQPRSPTTTGKIERFHQTMRREWLEDAGPFMSIEEAQANLDAWVRDYNSRRPHQALDESTPVTPSDRFEPLSEQQRELLPVWLPGTLTAVNDHEGQKTAADLVSGDTEHAEVIEQTPDPESQRVHVVGSDAVAARVELAAGIQGGPVEFDRVVPASGNLCAIGRQFWLGPTRAGQTVRLWVDVDTIHLMIGGVRIKSLRSHLSTADLEQLRREGAVAAGPAPLPAVEARSGAVEVDRTVASSWIVSLAGRQMLAAEILQGRRVSIRVEATILMFFDPDTRELLRTRPNPLTGEQVRKLHGARPAGPAPRPSTEPVTVRRRVSTTGVITVCGQKVVARTLARWADGHRARLPRHARGRTRRPRGPHHPKDHQPAGVPAQSAPTARQRACRGAVNGHARLHAAEWCARGVAAAPARWTRDGVGTPGAQMPALNQFWPGYCSRARSRSSWEMRPCSSASRKTEAVDISAQG
jgi:hypothetical protein